MARKFSLRKAVTNPAMIHAAATIFREQLGSADPAVRNKAIRGLFVLLSYHLQMNCTLKPAYAKRLAQFHKRS